MSVPRRLSLLLVLAAASATAQLPLGNAVQINQDNLGKQLRPDVAMAPDGSGWFVWANQNGLKIAGRSFTSGGSLSAETTVSTFVGMQGAPKIDLNDSGDRAMAWLTHDQFGAGSDYDVIVRHSTGGSLGAEMLGHENSAPEPEFTDVAIHTDDNLIVLWKEADGTLSAHRWASNSNSLGDDETIAFDSAMDNFAVAALPSGTSVAVFDAPSGPFGALGRLVAANGSGQGLPFKLSSTENANLDDPEVASDSEGGFVAAWIDYDVDAVVARRFRANATPVGEDILVSTVSSSYRDLPQVAVGPDGSFVVAWNERTTAEADRHIFAREFTRTGAPVGGPFVVEDDTHAVMNGVAMSLGRFMVVWTAPDQSLDGIFARLYRRRVIFSDGFEGGTTQYW
jgi:hypothetical protein